MPVYHTMAGTVETLEWGDGPELLVLLHAAAAGPHSLAALAALLQRPGRRVLAPALNRYGATVARDEADRIRAHIDVVHARMAIHPAERRVLFGHSMGGLIGLLGASEGISFDTIALYEPIVTACLREDVAEEAALLHWDRAIVARADIGAFITAWGDTPWDALPDIARTRLSDAAPVLIADMRAVSYHALPISRLNEVRTPVLLLQGARSPAITHAMTTRLATLLPQAKRVVVEGCGHLGPIQAPAAVAGVLTSIAGL
jgi:lipase